LTFDLRLGDCLAPDGLASIADKSVDHVICDPPYSERVHRRLGKEWRSDGIATRDALTFGHITREVMDAIAAHVARVTRRWVLVFCDELSFGEWVTAFEAAGVEYIRKGTWVKLCPMPQMSGDRPATGTEEIVVGHAPRQSGRTRWNGGGKTAVYRANPQEDIDSRAHPAQKPLTLVEAMVRDFTDPGETILDPFAGSGTTGVAALRLGRRFIGWERDPKYHAIASKRLAGERVLPDGFLDERQGSLLEYVKPRP
jgi:site-specific DNA-methyltransferase (adenine-specific)